MKNSILLLTIALLLFACKDNPAVKKVQQARENISNTQKVIKESTNIQESVKELSNAEPLTNDQMRDWLPGEIDGMKRTGFKTGAMGMMNIASVEATYASEDREKSFKIEVLDGAGEMGAVATVGLRMAFTMDFEEETETRTRKTVTKNGVKAIEEYDRNRNQSTIQLMHNDRFYVNATGYRMSVDELWKLIDKMKLNSLG